MITEKKGFDGETLALFFILGLFIGCIIGLVIGSCLSQPDNNIPHPQPVTKFKVKIFTDDQVYEFDMVDPGIKYYYNPERTRVFDKNELIAEFSGHPKYVIIPREMTPP